MSERTRLFRLKDPYDLPASDAQFIRAARENCAFHYAHCPEYRRVLDSFGFRPEELQAIPDLARLPFVYLFPASPAGAPGRPAAAAPWLQADAGRGLEAVLYPAGG